MAKGKNRIAPMGKQKEDTQSLSEKSQLRLQLLTGPDLKISKETETEKDVIELLSGSKIDLKKRAEELRKFLAKSKQRYEKAFTKDFYKQINRLNGWAISEDKTYQKPPIVARFTIEIIYRRFPKDILPALQHLNPYVVFGLRKFKHFQWLNDEGRILLEGYIEEATTMMETCKTWYEFRVKYSQTYNVPFQLNFIDDQINFIK
ncbi:P63C domain-containing protein [Dyadobacter chenwenxiniae]|uniref:P63C domain-containing protein n=1 Tax=Dyadobacter chenwenxiniae TaxID=2906456 RepID=A0A9X1PPJ5_9BACT|nr:P63C domain-containing protein [Dyadobacter chenwenxiniae]MCF0065102.1 P63C domain-containing protein [Dyadobacter chenwenxiniae]UON84626.1 P63C domain-containing protein [Dyadobacter chenwenxiniae]